MESYFTRNLSDTGRFFFIFGHTKDRFCEDNLVVVDLDHILYKHLKDIGYKRIIFYSMDEQLYFYDIDSFNWTKQPNEALKEKPVTKPVTKSNRLQGPIPGKLKSAASISGKNHATEQAEPPVNAGKLHFGKMDANMAFERIDYCVRDKNKTEIKTAVIFTNADDFIKYFVEDINRRVFDSFNQFDGLGPDNNNIVLFVFPNGAQSKVAAGYKDTFFEKRMTEANEKETARTNIIIINPPASAEIRNTINHYRLMRGLKVNFTYLDIVCKRIARELCKASRPLEWLMFALQKIVDNRKILDTEMCDAMFDKKDNETAMQKLGKLIGMEKVKEEIRILESRKESDEKPATNEKHHSRILPPVLKDNGTYNLHYVITGNPGTGKTTAAKRLGEILYESGYLESGHTIEVEYKDLVSQFNPGDTADKTNRKIEEAMGGVLFIDEAYTLAPSDEHGGSDWGKMAIDTILKAMSDRNGQFSVVVAGYPDKMKAFIDSNPGLKRRFLKTIHIDDYEPEELMQIFYRNLLNNTMHKKYTISEELAAMLGSFFENWHKSKDKNWGNAGEVEKLLQEMDGNWQKHRGKKSSEGELILDICDIPDELQKYCKPSQESKEDAMKKLKELIGLHRVKEKIEELKINIAFEGKTEPGHYIFAGSPGTGKTTVARLLGDILREEGVLRRGHVVEVKQEDLVAGYMRQTAPKTKEKLTEALDGILFIDEAYTLVEGGQNDFGKEAINTILAFMEDNRNRICVICAGYTKDMERFVEGNRGLKSRFTEIIHFDDYDVNELVQILLSFGIGYTMEQDFIQKSKEIFEIWINNKGDDFGNARDVRNYFNECKTTLRKRLITEYGNADNIPEDIKKTLIGQDIPEDKQQYCKPSQESKEDAMNKLKKLIGLSGVKERIEKLKLRINIEGATEPGHYVFAGNPGTGKTTVARLLGDILREEGVLRKGHVVEVLREDLVAGYQGQTAIKTKDKLQEALDGIFFLDEAYSLVQGDKDDFGQEAINTILAFIENNRARICAIFAGYTKNMEDFIQSNPGLTRRISETIVFEDYNTDEMVGILNNFAGDFVLEPEYIQKSRQIFDFWIENKTSSFGNAGQVRNYFTESKDALYERIYKEYKSDIPEEVKKTLTGQDIPPKYLHIAGGLANELVSTNNINKMEA